MREVSISEVSRELELAIQSLTRAKSGIDVTSKRMARYERLVSALRNIVGQGSSVGSQRIIDQLNRALEDV